MKEIAKQLATDFLIKKLKFTAQHAHAAIVNLTLKQSLEVPGLLDIAIKLPPIIVSLSENIMPTQNHMRELLRLVEANQDKYQLKIWHITHIFQSQSYLDPIISEIQASRYSKGLTLGTRQCAQSEHKLDFKYYNLLNKVFGVTNNNLKDFERPEIEAAIPALKQFVRLMNDTVARSGLTPATVFTDYISKHTHHSVEVDQLNLNPRLTQYLLAPMVSNHMGKNYISENFSENFSVLRAMEEAYARECIRLSICEEKLRSYYPFLKINAKFQMDSEQRNVAHNAEHYLDNYLLGHNYMCHNVPYYSYDFVQQVSRIGLFKSKGSQQHLYMNLSNALDDCDYKNMDPFLYFYTLKPLVTASAVAGIEEVLPPLASGFNNDNVERVESSANRDLNYYLFILMYLAFLLFAIYRQRRMIIQNPAENDFELIELLDDKDDITITTAEPGRTRLHPSQ